MKLVCDEGVERQIIDGLRVAGHEVVYVAELAAGISDDDVLSMAVADGLLLLTSDKDFGELVFRMGRAHQGVVLLRLAGLPSEQKAHVVVQAIAAHGEEFGSAFSVVQRDRIRIRHPKS